ncbi:MAG: DUF3093 family protein [Myxococcales bacterium]|nr:DUF3093 family protein [Myxococcales bacterium]
MARGVLHRERTRWRRHWLLLLPLPVPLLAAGLVLAQVGSRPAPPVVALGPAVGLVGLVVAWALFAVLRVRVTAAELVVRYGLYAQRIPVARITAAAAVDYDARSLGGWGLRRVRAGAWAYGLAGVPRAVRIEWQGAGGGARSLFVSSRDPERLVAAVERARAGGAPGP